MLPDAAGLMACPRDRCTAAAWAWPAGAGPGRRAGGGGPGRPVAGEQPGGGGDQIVDLPAQLPAPGGAGGLDVLQGDGLPGVLGADRPAQERAAVEDPDLGQIAGVIADGHRLADVGGQHRVQVAQALEVDAVALDGAGLGDHHQQQVQVLQRGGHPRQPPAGQPGLLRGYAGLAVRPEVVSAGDEPADRRVQLGQRQPRRGDGPAARQVAGQLRKQLGGDAAEQPLHLAPALRPPDPGVDRFDVQVGQRLGQVGAGEVRAVVDMQHGREAAHRPGRVGLAPDRLPQRQRGLQRGRGAEEDRVPGDRAGMIILDDGQPGPGGPAARIEHQQVQFGVVGLPDLVGAVRLPAVNQLEPVPVGHRAVPGQGDQAGIQAGDDGVHRGIGRRGPAPGGGDLTGPPVNRGDPRRRPAQRQPLDQRDQLRGDPAASPVRPAGPGQPGQALPAVAGQPALRGAQRDPRLCRYRGQRPCRAGEA